MKPKLAMVLMTFALYSCGDKESQTIGKEPQMSCAGIEAATARAQLAISMQMLRMEVSRDEVEDVGIDAVKKCDPQVSEPVYTSVRNELLHLVGCARSSEQRDKLGEINTVWKQLQDRHNSVWRNSKDVPGLMPKDRCIRASEVAESRISIERNWENIWTDHAAPGK